MKRLIRKSVNSSVDNNVTDANYNSKDTEIAISAILEYLTNFEEIELITTKSGKLALIADGIKYQAK